MAEGVWVTPATVPAQYSLVVLNTSEVEREYRRLREKAQYAVVADGAANRLWEVGRSGKCWKLPTHIVGDMDSICSEAREFFQSVQMEVEPSQDFNDCQEMPQSPVIP